MINNDKIIRSDEKAIFELRNLYSRYGYNRYKMSRFEEYDLYVRNKDFLVSDEVITFTDKNGRLLALKPDVTLSIIKNSVDREKYVEKLYYNENVYRVSQSTHNFKEIMQAGLECIGDLSFYEISEVVLLAAKSLSLISKNYVLDISHMGLIAAIMEDMNLSDQGRKEALVYLNQKNPHQLTSLLESEGVADIKKDKLLSLATLTGKASDILSNLGALMTTEKEKSAFEELSSLFDILAANGFGDNVRADFSVGNNMKYYSGVVLNGYIEGIPESVLSGGQYDRLLKKMKRQSSAIGFAIYLDLLERYDENDKGYDIDTVLLHSDDTDAVTLTELAEKLSGEGGVLVCREVPKGKRYRRLMKISEGMVTVLEENG